MLASDPWFYLAFDAGNEDCIDALGGGHFYLPPIAVNVIADIVAFTSDRELKTRASQALIYRTVNLVFCPTVSSDLRGCDTALASLLIERGIIEDSPIGKVRAQLIGECACLDVDTLFTLDSGLLVINQHALNEVISERDLSPFEIKTISQT